NTGYKLLKPPGIDSARTAERVTTPWRLSSWFAQALARSVSLGEVWRSAETSDHRPLAWGGKLERTRRGLLPPRLRAVKARTGAKVSLVTSPAHTRSHRASSTSAGSPPPTAA